MAKFTVRAYRPADKDYPKDGIAELYQEVIKENPVVRAGGNRSLEYDYGDNAWCLAVYDKETNKLVGGCIFEYWDPHVNNCLSVLAAMVLPGYRNKEATHALWRAIRWYGLGCQWISTTRYVGNNTYVTKYREV